MATIKQIDGRTIHQIQSGQVIVDLCSVVKELVENSIDAGATNIDVRFKNQGLDLIEVQDNGAGISPANYATVALKHHTSKLSTYADIGSLETFGFRGEALASLCALSTVAVTTCLQEDVPKGSKLSFETSGKLKDTGVVAAQRGTTVSVEKLFHNLPVRRRELERNIKREWNKVVTLLNQYACIQIGTKFSVSQQPTKGKRLLLFSTKGNSTTRDNIINIFGAKTMTALVPLSLKLEMEPTNPGPALQQTVDPASISKEVQIIGHVSRPTHGDGRQTPDRQMFFVNGRPCGLPQFAKAFNEVYKSYNSNQSPFIFADIQLDTHMYDVNVSPDKRTILLHDQNQLLESVRTSLVELFDAHDYSVPASHITKSKAREESENVSALPKTFEHLKSSEPAPKAPSEIPLRASPANNAYSERDDSPTTFRVAQGKPTSAVRYLDIGARKANQSLDGWVKRQDSPEESADDDIYSDSHHDNEEDDDDDVQLRPAPQDSKDLKSSQSENFQPTQSPIPAVRLMKGAGGGGITVHSSPTRRAPEPASVVIGKSRASSLAEDTRSRSRHSGAEGEDESSEEGDDKDENHEDEDMGEREDEDSSEEERPTFGTALSQRFASGQNSASQPQPSRPTGRDRKDNSKVIKPYNSDLAKGGVSESEGENEPTEEEETTKAVFPEPQEKSNPGQSQNLSEEDEAAPENASEAFNVPKDRIQTLQSDSRRKHPTLQLVHNMDIDEDEVQSKMASWLKNAPSRKTHTSDEFEAEDITAADAEAKLSLIISKSDFARMRVAGQFNLGFIVAVRPEEISIKGSNTSGSDELFIIDQHASDEKYNFERLQDATVLQSQRLVHPKRLELTALEEEIVMQSTEALEANGFKIDVNTDGDYAVGTRCLLTALPLSRETTFDLADLEELISLLGEESSESTHIPRPSKVRKMFAMRACRSSIMIGKALNKSQMSTLVGHMGELDKPWNCPHGRPTMRHLCRMQAWDEKGWAGDLQRDSLNAWTEYGNDA